MAKAPAPDFSNSVIHLLHRASQFADFQLESVAAETGLTARQLVVLDAISKLEEPSQTSICLETGIDRSTLADMVRRLCSRRLVVRKRSRKDARAYVLRLTDEGRSYLDKLASKVGQAEQTVMIPLPENDRRKFLDLLHKIAEQPLTSPSRKG